MRIYMNQAATSYPKPEVVIQAMVEYMEHNGATISRSTSTEATKTDFQIMALRELIAEFFHAEDPRGVIFTKNITEALNIVIHGLIEPGDRVLITGLEHNAVVRPLTQRGAEILEIPTSQIGALDFDYVDSVIDSVKAVISTHASNLTGDIVPIDQLAKRCQQREIPFIVDAAQSAGALSIDLSVTPIDALCFTGHKSLLGPTGTGGVVFRPPFAKKIPPLLTGGTGSLSDEENHPLLLPDRFEAGTPNIVGLIGLFAAFEYLMDYGLERRFQEETAIGTAFYDALQSIPGLVIHGSNDYSHKLPVFSFSYSDLDPADISYQLANQYGIANRCGLHCAPRAHKTYGTFPTGTVRLSLSHRTTQKEMDYVISALQNILNP